MKSTTAFFMRILLAAVLALLITPTANNVTGVAVAETEATYPAPAVVIADTKLADLAVQYGIQKPTLRFVESKVAGNTAAEPVGPEKGATIIRIGTPLQRPAYLERPELLQAVVAHEFGHAVMIARSDEFPAPAIFGMYGIGLFILLVVFPTKRGVLLGSIAIMAMLAIMTMIPKWEFINNAYLTFMLNLPVAAGTLWWAKIRVSPPAWIAIHLPSIRNLTLASLLAAPTFLSASWAIGGMNSERELRADVIGACATSPASMKDALLALNDKPPSAWTEAFDHFHPPMSARVAVLDALQNPTLLQVACTAVHDGKRRLNVANFRIQ